MIKEDCLLVDAHSHYSQELYKYLDKYKIYTILNCDNLKEYKMIQKIIQQSDTRKIYISLGIHPWKSNDFKNNIQILQIIKRKDIKIIGEIGLDQVWTNIAFSKQLLIFQKQLEIAYKYQKPVIIHLKNTELKVLENLQKYPNKYYIHWYTNTTYLQNFVNLNCYIGIGPIREITSSLRELIQNVPLERLLIESDGIAAMKWEYKLENINYFQKLNLVYDLVADIKKITKEKLIKQVYQNFLEFIE